LQAENEQLKKQLAQHREERREWFQKLEKETHDRYEEMKAFVDNMYNQFHSKHEETMTQFSLNDLPSLLEKQSQDIVSHFEKSLQDSTVSSLASGRASQHARKSLPLPEEDEDVTPTGKSREQQNELQGSVPPSVQQGLLRIQQQLAEMTTQLHHKDNENAVLKKELSQQREKYEQELLKKDRQIAQLELLLQQSITSKTKILEVFNQELDRCRSLIQKQNELMRLHKVASST